MKLLKMMHPLIKLIVFALVAIIILVLTVDNNSTDNLQSGCPVCQHVMYQTDQINETFIIIAAPEDPDDYDHIMLQVLACDQCGVVYTARWSI